MKTEAPDASLSCLLCFQVRYSAIALQHNEAGIHMCDECQMACLNGVEMSGCEICNRRLCTKVFTGD